MSAPNPSYKPSEGKREEFRKYLEKNGVMDALTKVLVNLYEEVDKPTDALEFIRDKLSTLAGLETHKQLKEKISELEQKLQQRSSLKEEEITPEVVEEVEVVEAPPMIPATEELPTELTTSPEEKKEEASEPQGEDMANTENAE